MTMGIVRSPSYIPFNGVENFTRVHDLRRNPTIVHKMVITWSLDWLGERVLECSGDGTHRIEVEGLTM